MIAGAKSPASDWSYVRILLISLYFPPDLASTGVLMEQLARDLQARGHAITVITSTPHYTDAARGAARRRFLPHWERGPDLAILRVPVPAFGKRESMMGRSVTYAAFNLFSLVGALFAGRQDIVFTPSPPLTSGLVSALIGRFKGIPSVYNVQDLVPEAYVQFGSLKSRRLISLFERIEAAVYRRNNRVSVISNSFRDHLIGKRVPSDKIDVVPNFVDLGEITPLARANELSTRLGLDERFVVMHAGSIAYRHGVEVLVDAARLLIDLPDVLFLIVGDGAKRDQVAAYAREANLPNVRMEPFVPRHELSLLRASADVQMIVLRRGMTSHSVPCKVYEIMGSERPVIAAVDEGSTIWELIRETNCGVAVQPECATEIAAAVRRLHADRRLAAGMAGRGRRHVEAQYSVQAVGRQYDAIFRRLAGQDA